ncbi:MAG: hypothetical protein GX352_03135 [Clostridiales bacterium]|nr:hypothetical protein [Clostridiales bacterium]
MMTDIQLAIKYRNHLSRQSREAHSRGEDSLGISLFREAVDLYTAIMAVRRGKDINLDREAISQAAVQQKALERSRANA